MKAFSWVFFTLFIILGLLTALLALICFIPVLICLILPMLALYYIGKALGNPIFRSFSEGLKSASLNSPYSLPPTAGEC